MTDQLPERIVAWPHGHWETLAGECLVTGNGGVFLRADTAIPRAEADAMVAAAFEQAQHTAQIAWNWPESEASSAPVCEAIAKLTPADARAAFERAVQVETSQLMAHLRFAATLLKDLMQYHEDSETTQEEKDAVEAALAAILAPQETSE